MYIALGNNKTIDIFKPNPGDGKLIPKKSITLSATFLGAIILSENLNQYLIILDSNKSVAVAYENINCQTMIKKQYEEKTKFKGNPILDVFYEAH